MTLALPPTTLSLASVRLQLTQQRTKKSRGANLSNGIGTCHWNETVVVVVVVVNVAAVGWISARIASPNARSATFGERHCRREIAHTIIGLRVVVLRSARNHVS
jgi:hypothetical protein